MSGAWRLWVCCRVIGDGARPRYRDGEYLLLLPERSCESGDGVVLEMQDGTHRVCELRAIGSSTVTVSPMWHRPEETIPVDQITRMYYVAGCVDEPPSTPLPWEVTTQHAA